MVVSFLFLDLAFLSVAIPWFVAFLRLQEKNRHH